MVKDEYVGMKIEKSLKEIAKHYARLEERTLTSFILQALREKIKSIQDSENL